MSSPATVPVEANVTMSASADIQHMCPFVQEVDNGSIAITWRAEGWTFELHSLRAYLNTFADREISHEDLTEEIRAELNGHHGLTIEAVSTTWRTAGMGINCFTSPIPAPRP